MKNADIIRGMSDEELAEWIFRNQMHIFKITCDAFGYSEYNKQETEYFDDILAWLKQEIN